MITKPAPDKPFKTIKEQIEILKNRKLIITNPEFAEEALFTFSYYDLINGYKEIFMIDNEFRPNTTIEDLYLFAKFDRNLQNILFQYSVIVETSFKTALAYVLSKEYGEFQDDYLKIDNYDLKRKNFKKFQKIIKDIKKSYIPNKNHPINEPTRHYVNTKNHVPAWILLKNVSFDLSTKLYEHMKSKDKEQVCNILLNLDIPMDRRKEFLIVSLNIIRRFRNKIAHNLKFITYEDKNYKIKRITLKGDAHCQLFEKSEYNNVYSMLICLNSIIKDISLKNEMNISILQLVHRYNSINPEIIMDYFSISGIPIDYEDIIKKLLYMY